MGNGHHPQRVLDDEAQLWIKLRVVFECVQPSLEVSHSTAPQLSAEHEQLVNGGCVLTAEIRQAHIGWPDHLMGRLTKVATHQPVVAGGYVAGSGPQIPWASTVRAASIKHRVSSGEENLVNTALAPAALAFSAFIALSSEVCNKT